MASAAVTSWCILCFRPSQQAPAGASVSPSRSIEVTLYPEHLDGIAYISARAGILQKDPSFNLLFFQDSLDTLALVGTEGDAGFSGAGTLFHLFLLVFLFHFNLEVMYKKMTPVSVGTAWQSESML